MAWDTVNVSGQYRQHLEDTREVAECIMYFCRQNSALDLHVKESDFFQLSFVGCWLGMKRKGAD